MDLVLIDIFDSDSNFHPSRVRTRVRHRSPSWTDKVLEGREVPNLGREEGTFPVSDTNRCPELRICVFLVREIGGLQTTRVTV